MIVLMDLSDTSLTVTEVKSRMESYRSEPAYAGYDIVLDMAMYAVVAVPREAV